MSLATHRGWALAASALVVILGLALVPQGWIRWAFGLHEPRGVADLALDQPREPDFIQLLPTGGDVAPEPPAFEEIRVEVPEPEVVVTEDQELAATEDDRGEWTFDPTRAHGVARNIEEFEVGVAPPDSVQLARSMLYREMSPGRWPASALVDYSDLAMAREKWTESDEWFRRVWGRRWAAQGDSARSWGIYDRAVTEVEEKGVH